MIPGAPDPSSMPMADPDRPWRRSCRSVSAEVTFRIGKAVGHALAVRFGPSAVSAAGRELDLAAGACLALVGELGGGKTVFTKGLAAGAGVDPLCRVTSPTFVIRQDYPGSLPVHHYDVYRLSGAQDLLALGFEEDLAQGVLVVVEWADRVIAAIPPEALVVEFEHAADPSGLTGTSGRDGGCRRLTFCAAPWPWADILDPILVPFQSC